MKRKDKRLKWLEEHADEAVKGIDAAVRDMTKRYICPACGYRFAALEPPASIPASIVRCPKCGAMPLEEEEEATE